MSTSYDENIDYDKKYGSFELARRIDKSVDIVTDLTDVVEEELPKKSLQGINEEATNTAILDALQNIVIDLKPIEDKIDASTTEILDAIDNIDFSSVEEKIDEIKDVVESIDDNATINKNEILNAISAAKTALQGGDVTATLTSIQSAIEHVVIDLDPVLNKLDDVQDTIMQGITGVASQITTSTDTIVAAVQGITGYAKESTLVQGITGIRSDLSILLGYFDEVTYESVMEELMTDPDGSDDSSDNG